MGEQHKQGFLTKEGGGWKSWKKRFFVLRNGELRYSKKPEGGSLGIISLLGAGDIQSCEYKRKEFCFSIQTSSRTWYMCAASDSDRESWVSVLGKEKDRLNKPGANGAPAGASGGAVSPKQVGIDDFLLMRVIGQGSFGKVFQVRKKDNDQIYAMKVLTKSAIIQRGEVQHTLTELNILKNLVHPFLVNMYVVQSDH
jgi:RAC serine/threonine-protein kinase